MTGRVRAEASAASTASTGPGAACTEVAIFGSYNRQSIGDRAILVGLLEALLGGRSGVRARILAIDPESVAHDLAGRWPDGTVRVESVMRGGPAADSRAVPNTAGPRRRGLVRQVFSAMPAPLQSATDVVLFAVRLRSDLVAESDCLLIGGGNLVMDLFPSWPAKMRLVGRRFERAGKPVLFAGVGANEPCTARGRRLLGRTLRGAETVSVRDVQSARILHDVWGVRSEVLPDFAISCPRPRGIPGNADTVAVNPAPLGGPGWPVPDQALYRRYVTALSTALASSYHRAAGARRFDILLTNYPTDRPAALELLSLLSARGVPDRALHFTDSEETVADVLVRLAAARLAVTTRLHAALMSCCARTPCVPVAYQPKVRHALAQIGHQRVVDLSDLDTLEEEVAAAERDSSGFLPSEAALRQADQQNRAFFGDILAALRTRA